ncbi:PLDc_N domain-containing protein [Cellulomonas sp. zg-ZUI222]|uniref:PLDc_N domain-containing protein n=1 Tax=Cellulomonas wangleii TaxID=2816956 RepID=A0ABX8D719_9CELL|nr:MULTISPECIES: PLD nuclease N-terminal domain-containing protein [Cellulomonas]MBO0901651.1 PLDc_N domain-containing protein [Cellulomonas sp. zg-ZUI22]MBO0922230.1 PLDc_N domain-containing protein [Cellulomonas wangleii]MBO0925925.1 PLDc_N domain-containing protein [Cellulomonas wangleii]QVI63230.1 PLDc_N domain-containing protein [Cellulomonas wangleii]
MLRFLPVIVEIALLVFCLIDCIQSDSDRVRNLSKGWWLVLIVVLPLAGGIAWLTVGRPQTPRTHVPWRSTQTAGFPEYEHPRRFGDDDVAAARRRAEERRSDDLHEQMLRDWEAQLRAREQGTPEDGAPRA